MLFRENLNQPSLSPSGSTRFPGGKTKLQRGNFTYRGGQSSWTTEQGFRSHSFKTEPQTKESSGRAIFVVKSIIPKYTPNTHYYMQERRRESLNHVSHDHLQRQTRGQCTSRRALSERQWGAVGSRPALPFPGSVQVTQQNPPLLQPDAFIFQVRGESSYQTLVKRAISTPRDGC